MNKRLLCFLLSALMFCLSAGRISAEAEETENVHYLGFASDLHGIPDVLEDALSQFPHTPEYFSMIGDMVGDRGNMRPAYSTSEVLDRITGIFPGLSPESGNISVIWADHDMNAVDDAGILRCAGDPPGYLSGQIFEGRNSDGTTAYYIYGVGYCHMADGGPESREAAEAFKEWVKDKDLSVPVIVLCHLPLMAKRGDNLGAYYWNEALNYAATGIEGIMTEDAEEAQIIRNVIYLYGHNHTVDPKEYIHEAGTAMTVQIDTNLVTMSPGGGAKIIETEAYDEEAYAEENQSEDDEDDPVLTAPPGPNVKAQGVVSKIYYTAAVAGYMKTSGSASLLTITDTEITLRKFSGQGEVSLGFSEAEEPVPGPLVIERIRWNEPEYTWSDDLSEVTAVRTLSGNPSCNETETVSVTGEITKEPSCTEAGEITYTAVFENSAFGTQTKIMPAEAAGHTPGSPSEENYAAPSCTADGSYDEVIRCEVCGEELTRKTIPVGALGHSWGEWKITKEPAAGQDGYRTRTCRNDPSHTETETIPAESSSASYRFTEGAGSAWEKGSSAGLYFTVKRDKEDSRTYSLFARIEADGKILDPSCYTVSQGSLKITLKPSYLANLKEGTHTLKAVFTDGCAETTFRIRSGKHSPKTNDETGILFWFCFLSGSLIVSAGSALYLRNHSEG